MAENWNEVGQGDLVKFVNSGDEVIGKYLGFEMRKGKFKKKQRLYSFQDAKDKGVKAFFGSVAIDRLVDSALEKKVLKDNGDFKLVFQGEVKISGGKRVKQFKLFTK